MPMVISRTPNKWDKLNLPGASGGAFGTIQDLVRFGNVFLADGMIGENRILGRKTVEFMTKKHIHEKRGQFLTALKYRVSLPKNREMITDYSFLAKKRLIIRG